MANPQKELVNLRMFELETARVRQRIEQAISVREQAFHDIRNRMQASLTQQNTWIQRINTDLASATGEMKKIQNELQKCQKKIEETRSQLKKQKEHAESLEAAYQSASRACEEEKKREEQLKQQMAASRDIANQIKQQQNNSGQSSKAHSGSAKKK